MASKNSVQSIVQKLTTIFKIGIPPAPKIPPQLGVIGAVLRPGLNPQLIASRIMRRRSEVGGVVGPAPDGTQNVTEGEIAIMVEEIINAIQFEAKIDVLFPPDSIRILSTGANNGGPVVCDGRNINIPVGTAIIQ
jgi:hypothetical protein